MSVLSMINASLGGLGLFLLGMWLMSDGLKMAAGSALHHFLHAWTDTRLRGLSVGIFLTSLVQSSSAVTVATIGFTNAGLLSLKRAIWIIFGSNIGTTTTGWLVTLIGFNFKISAFALPMIGIGMVLKLVNNDSRWGALGQAIVGFGILFLGIDVLKDTFSELGSSMSLVNEGDTGWQNIVMFAGLGFLITVLVQSSSVTLALTLTALAGGVMALIPAAAIVIGSNLGSTTTAVLSSFGTNSIAKRVVASHVIFNILTATVSLALLYPLINFILFSQDFFNLGDSATLTLALFHTLFNVLGVLLMWPIANILIKWLKRCFKTKGEEEGKAKYLDKNTLALPSLALHALSREIERLSAYSLAMARDSINFETNTKEIGHKNTVIKQLTRAIGDYTTNLYTQNLTEDISEKLPIILRVSHYYGAISELSVLVSTAKKQVSTALNPVIQQQVNAFYKNSLYIINQAKIGSNSHSSASLNKKLSSIESEYQSLKSLLLRRGAEGSLSIAKMNKTMISISHIRRINQQAIKALTHFESLNIAPKSSENMDDKMDIITTV
ncbi:MAG: Na/Pi cotransporter family protein [Methylophaga sp.]|nr:Na/Pi cotransporter family protein [Methylophaga sp.]